MPIAHAPGSATQVFGRHFVGGVEESGRQLDICAVKVGFGLASTYNSLPAQPPVPVGLQGRTGKMATDWLGGNRIAHRYVIQERLKLPGAWWTPTNVEVMLALCRNRANREYDGYWLGIEKQAA